MKLNKKTFLPLCLLMLTCSTLPVSAADYNFNSEYETDDFGKSTTSDVPPDYSATENVRRDKNSTYFPPSYGTFSGEFPTDPTSKYHTPDTPTSVESYNNTQYYAEDTTGGFLTPTSSMIADTATNTGTAGTSSTSNVTVSYYGEPEAPTTSVSVKSDGSIGSISIPKLGLDKKIYEGTDLDTMKIGVGHFTFTSQWSGNVGLASHNRGSASFFSGIWNLENGDKINYKTDLGTKTYYVFNKVKVDETDLSLLASTYDNTITLITCVEGQNSKRWVIQARE